MKMSDTFKLPISVLERGDQDYFLQDAEDRIDGSNFGSTYSDCSSSAIIHAVNNHDALVEGLKSARHMLWATKNNMQNNGSPESLELAVMIAKEYLRELDKLIEKFEGES